MPSILTLSASTPPSLGDCKIVYNPRTKRCMKLCFIGKSDKNRSGWQFKKGSSHVCER